MNMKQIGLFFILKSFSCFAMADLLEDPPMITAKSWAVADGNTGLILFSEQLDTKRQIASLTKLMTALVVLEDVAKTPEVLNKIVSVSHQAAKIHGTSAGLEMGEYITIRDLLYGLLLPSGNDAAVMLAEFFGRRTKPVKDRTVVSRFLDEMNKQAHSLGMADTSFVDVHGMGGNTSTPRDLLRLADVAMKNSLLQEIVSTDKHTVRIRSNRGGLRTITWQNTNDLLGHFDGIKTGHTHIAGGCLLLSGTHAGQQLYVVVLESDNKKTRFMDAYNLFQWALQQVIRGDASARARANTWNNQSGQQPVFVGRDGEI